MTYLLSPIKESPVSVVEMREEMLSDLTKLHLDTFSRYIHARIGKTYVQELLQWFCNPKHGVALAAIDSTGRPIGYVVGARVGYAPSLNRDMLWVGMSSMVLRPWLCFETEVRRKISERIRLTLGGSPIPHSEPDLPVPTLSLFSLAVSPAVRRQSVGRGLVKSFELKGQELDVRSLRLSVYPNNTTARRFYEDCGWQSFSGPVRETGEMYYYRVLDRQMDTNIQSLET